MEVHQSPSSPEIVGKLSHCCHWPVAPPECDDNDGYDAGYDDHKIDEDNDNDMGDSDDDDNDEKDNNRKNDSNRFLLESRNCWLLVTRCCHCQETILNYG